MVESGEPIVLGRYVLHDVIAAGGMARVHLARLLGPVGFTRTVAIKRLHPHFAMDPEFVAMFLDEARLAARIRHPNVVPTLDVVATDGELFLVMEYVHGESLWHLLRLTARKDERIPLPFTSSIVAGALRGLNAAHDATNERGEPLGIVHRDVSPQNILVGIDGTPRVVDFGVAKAAGRAQSTRDGQLKGKMAYMPPEQLLGTRVDRRSDVYAVAVVLWEALAGRRLFKGENDAEVFGKVLNSTVAPPSTLTAGIPAELDAITLKGLARDPDQRFATARDMARALERVVAPVAPADVGEWVESLGQDSLAARAQQISRIESSWDSAGNRVAAPVPSAPDASSREDATQTSSPSAQVGAPEIAATPGEPGDVTAQLSSASVSASRASAISAGGRRRSERTLATVVAGSAVLLLAVGLFLRAGHEGPQGVAVPASSVGFVSPPTTSAQGSTVSSPVAAPLTALPASPEPPASQVAAPPTTAASARSREESGVGNGARDETARAPASAPPRAIGRLAPPPAGPSAGAAPDAGAAKAPTRSLDQVLNSRQ